MQETLNALLQLQEIDREIFRVQSELKRLPAERDARKAELDRRKTKIDEVRHEANLVRVKIKEIEDLSTQQRQRMRKVENEAAGSRQDMALLVAYQHEIRTLKREIGTAEEEALGLLEKAEGHDATVKTLTSELEADLKIFGELQANVQKELSAAQKRLADLEAQRKLRTSSKVPPEHLATYTRLLQAREGVAIVGIDSRICQGCFMELPKDVIVRVNRGVDLIRCPSCDRILYSAR